MGALRPGGVPRVRGGVPRVRSWEIAFAGASFDTGPRAFSRATFPANCRPVSVLPSGIIKRTAGLAPPPPNRVPEMCGAQNRVAQHHARSGIAHDQEEMTAQIRCETIGPTQTTGRLLGSLVGTAFDTFLGIPQKRAAIATDPGRYMALTSAVDRDQVPNSQIFTLQDGIGLARWQPHHRGPPWRHGTMADPSDTMYAKTWQGLRTGQLPVTRNETRHRSFLKLPRR